MGVGASLRRAKVTDGEHRWHNTAEAILAEEKKRLATVFKLLLLGR